MNDASHLAGAGVAPDVGDEDGASALELLIPLAASWRMLVLGPLAVGLIALGIAFLIPPTFTARTAFLPPPQQQQGAAAAALSSLGALSGLAGVSTRTLGDQYVALLQSVTIEDRLIDKFKLMDVYETRLRQDTRRVLAERVRVSLGKKDGIITLEVDDHSPERAAAIANQHVEELRRLAASLALTEAQQRRAFFQKQLENTRQNLAKAQQDLQASGFNAGALRSEPKAAADTYARLRAQVTGAEVRVQTLRRSLTDSAPEVQQELTMLAALRDQMARVEASDPPTSGPDYMTKYREFKYQETLFDVFARQFESARIDESSEGSVIQVIDPAAPPERKSRPSRSLIAIGATLVAGMVFVFATLMRDSWRRSSSQASRAATLQRLRGALRGR